MCTLFYACSWDQVTALLTGFALFAMFIAIIVMGTLVGIEYERRKRTGIDGGHIDQIIKSARRRAYERGQRDE